VLSADARRGRAVLAELRRTRRRRRIADFDPLDALYRVYVTAVVSGVSLWLLSGVVGDHRVGRLTAVQVVRDGPQIVGAAIAVVVAVGLRAGGRGGPLVIEAPEVRHVLLAPVDRAVALRGPAVRLLRFGAAAGAGVGALIGLMAFRRLPGPWAAWIGCGAMVGALAVDAALGAAMAVAGRRLGRVAADGLGLAVVAWSALDVVIRRATSPASWLGQVALWPLRWRPGALGGVAVAAALVWFGVLAVGGTSIEASERRAGLAGQIRFAATARDLRTVIVLRRQLSQELPRGRPWIRLSVRIAGPLGAQAGSGRWAVWRRGWQGILRFPAIRLARMAVLAAAAGAAAVGAWRGTTPLVFVAGVALYVAGLDVVEPLAQEIDRPTLLEGYPLPAGVVLVRLFSSSAALMVGVGAIGAGTAVAVAGGSSKAWAIAAVMWVPASLAGLAGAAISTVQGPPPLFSTMDSLVPPEVAGARAMIRMVWPPLVATAGILPILASRHTAAAGAAVAQSGVGAVAVAGLVVLVLVWLRYRDQMHASVSRAMAGADAARRPSVPFPAA
jgi:hypothetical protein